MTRIKLTSAQARQMGLDFPKRCRVPNHGGKAGEEYRRTIFLAQCQSHGIPVPIHEYQFALPRKWAFDWAWPRLSYPSEKLALEIQGGIWTTGRHVRGAALLKEHEKLNRAACLGWRVLFCTPDDVTTGDIFPTIREALGL